MQIVFYMGAMSTACVITAVCSFVLLCLIGWAFDLFSWYGGFVCDRHGGYITEHHLKYSREARIYVALNMIYKRYFIDAMQRLQATMAYLFVASLVGLFGSLIASAFVGGPL